MSALGQLSPDMLAELLMSAATRLSESGLPRPALAPLGVPIRRGRLHLGRLRSMLDPAEPAAAAVGFATAEWLGPRDAIAPDLGRLAYRTETTVDGRGRVVLDCGCGPGWEWRTR